MPHKLNLGASVESLPRINPSCSDLKILLGEELKNNFKVILTIAFPAEDY